MVFPNPKTSIMPRWMHGVCAGLFCLLLASLSIWIVFKTRNAFREYKFIGVPVSQNTITVTGQGKVTAVPDVAVIDLGMTVEKKTVAEAQQNNTDVMNALIAKLKDLGVTAKDIQTTAYYVNPVYDYSDGRQSLRGYQVYQSARVKVRQLDRAGAALAAAGALGANQIGGLAFSVDDPEALTQQARLKALENAKEKAEALASVVGVKLRRIISFGESTGGPLPPPIYARGIGGAAVEGAVAPTVEPGSAEITVTADVTYEIE